MMVDRDPDLKIAELKAQLELAQIETARAKAAVADAGAGAPAAGRGAGGAVVPTIVGLGAAGFLARSAAISSVKAREARQAEEARQAKAKAQANANVGGVAIAAIAAATVALSSGGGPSDTAMVDTGAPAVLERPAASEVVVKKSSRPAQPVDDVKPKASKVGAPGAEAASSPAPVTPDAVAKIEQARVEAEKAREQAKADAEAARGKAAAVAEQRAEAAKARASADKEASEKRAAAAAERAAATSVRSLEESRVDGAVVRGSAADTPASGALSESVVGAVAVAAAVGAALASRDSDKEAGEQPETAEVSAPPRELTEEEKAEVSADAQSRASAELYRMGPFEALDYLTSDDTQTMLRAAFVPPEVIAEAVEVVEAAVGREVARMDAESAVAAELAFMSASQAQAYLNSRDVQTRLLDARVSPRVISECREIVAEAAREQARRRKARASAVAAAAQAAAATSDSDTSDGGKPQAELLKEWRESAGIASWYDAGVRLVPASNPPGDADEQAQLLGGVAVALALGVAAYLQQGGAPPAA